ncbi:DMT family transporter [Falsiroseomonas oryziterrae]|uniref:DMT family transporter n=1 Tax=Falsiroseomonas oryziterrae TaxID=2911368 RepID=UPI001F3FE9A4|nr:DMT family transporter [Roseomonas sp. NPKOSM-4]
MPKACLRHDAFEGTLILGPLLMLLGIGCFGLLDAASKLLSAEHTVWQVLLVRFTTILAVVFALRMIRPGWGGAIATRHPRIHLARALAMLGSASCFFMAFTHLPLIEGYLVFFTSPFMVLALTPWVLRERVPAAAWGWVGLGFAGVAIGLAPGLAGGVGGALTGYAWAFAGTLCYSAVFVLNRSLRHETGVARVLVWPTLLGFVVMLGPGLATWTAPDALALGLMVMNGLIVGVATVALAEAFRHADAARLAPFGYSGLVWSLSFDLALWGHLPGWPMVAGATVVVLACVMSERAAGRRG